MRTDWDVASIQAELDSPIPASEIEVKENKFDYVKGGWVTAELNRIFGFNGWSMRSTVHERVATGQMSKSGKELFMVHASAVITLADGTSREDHAVGSCWGLADLHAGVGEAVTDAFKRAASRLGVRTGGMLYLRDGDERRMPPHVQQLCMALRCAPGMDEYNECRKHVEALRGTPHFGYVARVALEKKRSLNDGEAATEDPSVQQRDEEER